MRRAMFVVAALLAATAGGSSSTHGVRTGDLLDLGESRFTICVPAPADGEGSLFGDTWLRNLGDVDVTIVDVSLVDPRGMTLREVVLVDVLPHEDLVGIRHTSDPSPLPAGWRDRIDARGAVLEPGGEWNIVFVVESHAEDVAVARAAKLSYEDARGIRYQQDTLTTMMVSHRPCDEALDLYE